MSALRTGAVLLVLALLWQALSLVARGMASPLQAAARLADLLGRAAFWADIAATAQAFGLALALSLAGGLLLGVALGSSRLLAAVTEPVLVNLYALPKVTLYPVVLLLFGLGLWAKVAFGVMHGLIPLALFTANAIAQLRPVLLRTARVLRLSRGQTMLHVILPAIVPEVLAGARLAVSLSLLGVLIGEMFASTRGLGHRVMAAMEAGDMAGVLGVALLLSAAAVALNAGLLALGPRAS